MAKMNNVAPSQEQAALQQLPPLPRHDAAVAAGREGLLDVAPEDAAAATPLADALQCGHDALFARLFQS